MSELISGYIIGSPTSDKAQCLGERPSDNRSSLTPIRNIFSGQPNGFGYIENQPLNRGNNKKNVQVTLQQVILVLNPKQRKVITTASWLNFVCKVTHLSRQVGTYYQILYYKCTEPDLISE